MNSEEIIKEQQKLIEELTDMLQWYVDEDEIIEKMEGNEYWVEGKYKALALISKVKGEAQ